MTARHALSPIGLGALLGALVKVIPSRAGVVPPSVMGKAGDTFPAVCGARAGRDVSSFRVSAMVERVACHSTMAGVGPRHGATAQPIASRGCQDPRPQAASPSCNPNGSFWPLRRPPAVRRPVISAENHRFFRFRALFGHCLTAFDVLTAVALVVAVVRNFMWS